MEANDTLILLSLTQTEINAITSPDIGGMLYNSTTNTVQIFNGSAWKNSTITDTDDIPEGSINLYNATHTGEITGSVALILGPTAISNKAAVTAASGMEILVNDTATLDGGNIITPPEMTNDVHDYNPTGFSTCNMIRQSIDSNGKKITGFPAPAAGVHRIIAVNNISSSGRDIRFEHQDSNSSSANRLYLRDNGARTIRPNETAMFWYDHTSSGWRSYNRIG